MGYGVMWKFATAPIKYRFESSIPSDISSLSASEWNPKSKGKAERKEPYNTIGFFELALLLD